MERFICPLMLLCLALAGFECLAAPAEAGADEIACLEKDDASACIREGKHYYGEFTGSGNMSDLNKARELSDHGCKLNNAAGCWYAGIYYTFGEKTDLKKYADRVKKACELKDLRGCGEYAHALYFGVGVKKNVDKSLEYALLACEQNISGSCSLVGSIYLYFFENNGFQDEHYDQALKYLKQSCKTTRDRMACKNVKVLEEARKMRDQEK